MIGGIVLVALFWALLAARLPSGPIIPVAAMVIGAVLFLGGATAHLRRRRRGIPAPTQHGAPTKFRIPTNWLIVVFVVSIVGIALELPATIGGQPIGIVGISLAGLTALISGWFLVRRIRSDRSAGESAKGRKEDL